jgi:Brp/Blh family beta-carotene 15,15'-monooxygenase
MENVSLKYGKLHSFIVVSTFFALWLAVFFGDHVEHLLAYVLILTFGILHGANDLKLLQKAKRTNLNGMGFVRVLAYYIIFVGISLALFYFIPSIALLSFIIFSGYHFGEQHWVMKLRESSAMGFVFYLFYGLFILFLLFYAHWSEVSGVVATITGHDLPKWVYGYGLLFSASGSLAALGYLRYKGLVRAHLPKEVFFVLVFFVIFNTASLLWAFAIYFILWHSLPSLADQIMYLYGNIGRNSIRNYIRSSFPYWVISVLGLLFLLYVFRNNVETSLSFFFSFLAAITFPHVLVINRLNRD